MNVRLDDVTMFNKDGRSMPVEQVYLRGSQIRFVIVPSMFKNAPMFKRVRAQAKQRITQQIYLSRSMLRYKEFVKSHQNFSLKRILMFMAASSLIRYFIT
jgi:hypothetical protein